MSAGTSDLIFSMRLLQVVVGLLGERDHAKIADVAFGAELDGANGDDVAHDRQFDRLVGALAQDRQLDRGADGATHLLDRIFKLQATNVLAVDLGNEVAGENAGAGRGRVVDRARDLDEVVFHRHFDAEAAEFAAGLGAHVLGVGRVHVARMRIKRREHAIDGILDQLVVLRRRDVLRAHALEHVTKNRQLAISRGIGRDGRNDSRINDAHSGRTHQRPDQNK